MSGNDETVAGSFRDPAGFVFRRDGAILRHVARSYGPIYDRLVASGLYQSLVSDGLLLPHDEVPAGPRDKEAHRILAPVEVPFISYPYEWCFSQLRDSGSCHAGHSDSSDRVPDVAEGRQRVQHSAFRRSSGAGRHAVLRGIRRGLSVGRV